MSYLGMCGGICLLEVHNFSRCRLVYGFEA